jgi:hypothetical protein
MIPAGRERDKRIAELKGYIWHDIPADAKGENAGRVLAPPNLKNSGWVPPPKGKVPELIFVPKYSTDDAIALELWDELIKIGLMPVIRTIEIDHGEIGFRVIVGNKTGETHEGWTLADAISGAYLNYKEYGGNNP